MSRWQAFECVWALRSSACRLKSTFVQSTLDHLDFDIYCNNSCNSIICLHALVSSSLISLIYTKPTVLAEMTVNIPGALKWVNSYIHTSVANTESPAGRRALIHSHMYTHRTAHVHMLTNMSTRCSICDCILCCVETSILWFTDPKAKHRERERERQRWRKRKKD